MPNLRPWSDSLLVRIMLVMVIGVISAQLLGAWLLTRQMRETVRNEALSAGRFLAVNAAGSIRFFRDLPPQYRPILIEQLRTMGGTRFFINVNSAYVPVKAIESNALVDGVVDAVHDELVRALKGTPVGKVCLAWPDGLQVSEDGRLVSQLPASWVEATLLLRPRPAPVLVMQIEFEKAHWLYLAATMPDPYFLDNADPLTWERNTPQLVMLLAVLLWAVWMVWALVYPINRIAAAANAFGSSGLPEPIPETRTAELRRTARAFNAMHARIQSYLLDRERLFMDISHSLRTPITRLKLRTEMLDDEPCATPSMKTWTTWM
jgi:signal transduction histidine kinase